MVQFTTILSTAIVAGLAIAQEPNPSFNESVISGIAGEISSGDQAAWCNAQYRACNVLCGKASANNCNSQTLNYTCTCASNSSSPAFQYYNPTMLTNICNRYLGDCLAETAGRADQQENCKNTIVCGNVSIDDFEKSGGAAQSSSASQSSSTAPTGGATASPTPSRAAAVALEIGSSYGTGLIGAVILGAFGLVL